MTDNIKVNETILSGGKRSSLCWINRRWNKFPDEPAGQPD